MKSSCTSYGSTHSQPAIAYSSNECRERIIPTSIRIHVQHMSLLVSIPHVGAPNKKCVGDYCTIWLPPADQVQHEIFEDFLAPSPQIPMK